MVTQKRERFPDRGWVDRIEFLDGLRAAAILMVVGIHSTSYVPLQGPIETWVNFIVRTVAVPAFFLCDGYLLAIRTPRAAPEAYTSYLGRSVRRLLVPWVIFSALYTAARALFEEIGVLREHLVLGQSVGTVLLRIYGSGIAPQMYFLLSLFAIRCGIPLWRRLVTASPAVNLSVFIAYAIAFRYAAPTLNQVFSIELDPVRHALWGLQFYLAGVCLARLRHALASRYSQLALASATVLAIALGSERSPYWVLQYSYLLAAFFLFASLPRMPWLLASVGRDTMGIYLLHAPVLLKACSLAVSKVLDPSLGSYLTVALAVFAISWFVTRVLENLPYGSVVFGIPPGRRA